LLLLLEILIESYDGLKLAVASAVEFIAAVSPAVEVVAAATVAAEDADRAESTIVRFRVVFPTS